MMAFPRESIGSNGYNKPSSAVDRYCEYLMRKSTRFTKIRSSLILLPQLVLDVVVKPPEIKEKQRQVLAKNLGILHRKTI